MSRSLWLSVCLVGLFSFPAHAQVIHGHPQKTFYASSAEWPTFSTPQCHWRSETIPMLAHVHFDLHAPYYAELTGAIQADFTITQYHLSGQSYFSTDRVEGVRTIVWDATGTAVSPPMIGDPMGIPVYTGHLVLDPTLASRWKTTHGWWAALMQVTTFFTNGDRLLNELIAPFYITIDPSAPETTTGTHQFMASCIPFDSAQPDINWGKNFIATSDYLPIAPIAAPWTMRFDTAGYGAALLPPATFQQRVDLDLHHGIPGTILEQIVQSGDISANVTFDPGTLGAGTHKMAIFRIQPSLDNAAEVNSLFVFPVVVGGTVGPPVDCVVGPWVLVSTTTSTSAIMTMGNIQSKTDSLNNLYQRTILTPASNGGAACPAN